MDRRDEAPFGFNSPPMRLTEEQAARMVTGSLEERRAYIEELTAQGIETPADDNWTTVSGGRLPFPVDLWLGRDRHGRLTVLGLRIEGFSADPPHEVTSTSLREVSIALGDVLRYIAEYRFLDPEVASVIGPWIKDTASPYGGVARRPGRKGHSLDFYREVAEGFVAAKAEDPEHPYGLLARRLYRSETQVRRLVHKAREHYPDIFAGQGGGA